MIIPSGESGRITDAERLNLLRWNSGRKGFQEVTFLQWNDPVQKVAGWLRFVVLSPVSGSPKGQLWAIFFDREDPRRSVAFKQEFPIDRVKGERAFFYLQIGPGEIFQAGTRGEVSSQGTRIRWDLKFSEGPLLRQLPPPFYSLPFPKTKIVSPRFHTRLSGEWTVADRTWRLNGAPAHQSHFWGPEGAHEWAWGHCGSFREDPEACFEGLTARVRLGRHLSPPLTLLFFLWKGGLYRFNALPQWFRNASRPELDRWHFEARDRSHFFVGDLRTDVGNLIALTYDDPKGNRRICRATLLADLKIRIFAKRKNGWEPEGVLTAEKSAAFETVGI